MNEKIFDKKLGTILGLAASDALGAPYEFGSKKPGIVLKGDISDFTEAPSSMWNLSEWTDDTDMSIPILKAVSSGRDLTSDDVLDEISYAWVQWGKNSKDVGIQTRKILSSLNNEKLTGIHSSILKASKINHDLSGGKSGGNGSLMRTAPVGLIPLRKEISLEASLNMVAVSAKTIASLTHYEKDAQTAAAIWSIFIFLAVNDLEINESAILDLLFIEERSKWYDLMSEAKEQEPDNFQNNGWVVHAFQAAYSALNKSGLTFNDEKTYTLDNFIKAVNWGIDIHNDTDTVGAITGSLAGALVGAGKIPAAWTSNLNGYDGNFRTKDLFYMVENIMKVGE